ncbi:DUF2927 domain-containing protein [Chachezhania sediminis]|uniref:DUF2927 domain-containing protein n=1 Tax=Chachezhania sediminis TaxID=2599291 RepID=UPI001E616587|nr:DUF2927 domain-containing protein [Chachezhania sediminis]
MRQGPALTIRRLSLALSTLILAGHVTGCAPLVYGPEEGAEATTRAQPAEAALPPIKGFAGASPRAPDRANADMARDFLDLHFRLESGRELDVMTRFEGPITVRVTGRAPVTLIPDLDALLVRLRDEAGIDIRRVTRGPASITIAAVRSEEIAATLPGAACFVVPNVESLAEYRRFRKSSRIAWSALKVREKMGIFIPDDAPPQEIRDCLHEELAQALGPLNDLYRLPDSIFNDDNVHTVLTGFDMLMLQATYAPELASGMDRDTVAAALPGVLSRLNPAGDRRRKDPLPATPPEWMAFVQTALGPGADQETREEAARNAAVLAQKLGWHDHRRAFAYYMMGRMTQLYDPEAAQAQYRAALAILNASPDTALHAAYVTTQTAAYAISRGDGAGALRQIRPQLKVAAQAQNGALLSTLMLLEAEALDLEGRPEKARAVRLDSLGYARYGFGDDGAVRAKVIEIAALNPVRRQQMLEQSRALTSLDTGRLVPGPEVTRTATDRGLAQLDLDVPAAGR